MASNLNLNSNNIPSKKPKKNVKKKTKESNDPLSLFSEMKSIKIPEQHEEKEKLMQSLRRAIAEIDMHMKNLKSKRDYYSEIVCVIENELKERNERILKQNKDNDRIALNINENFEKIDFTPREVQDKVSFYSYTRNPNIKGEVNFFECAHLCFNINNIVFTNAAEPEEKSKEQQERNCNIEECAKIQKDISFNYEDFNAMDCGDGVFTQAEAENVHMLTSDKHDNISDRFQLLSKPNNQQKHLKETEKKTLTREDFSQHVNSLGKLTLSSSDSEVNKICTRDFVSQPDYESFPEEKLKEECKKYGLKPGSNKSMLKQLKEIWNFIHTKVLPEHLRKKLTIFLNEPTECDINNESLSSQISQNSDANMGLSSLNKFKNIIPGSVKKIADNTQEKIVNTVIEDKELWSKILTFKKIELKEVKTALNKNGIIVENELLKEFLTSLGVILTQN